MGLSEENILVAVQHSHSQVVYENEGLTCLSMRDSYWLFCVLPDAMLCGIFKTHYSM